MSSRPPLLLLLAAVLLLLGGHGSLSAQPSDSIVANPNAVKLRRIWLRVARNEQTMLGAAGGSVGDINGDSIGDFAVWQRSGQYRIYYGGYPAPDTIADWTAEPIAADPGHPSVGRFWGDDRFGVVFKRNDSNKTGLLIYRIDSNRLPDEPTIRQSLGLIVCIADYAAADLDGDGADELIVSEVCDADLTRTLIYKGGPGFQLDSPTVVVNDGEGSQSSNYFLRVGNLDGDEYPDLVTAGFYAEGAKLKFWWGRPGSPWNWADPDRVILLSTLGHLRVGRGLWLFDCDGDGVADLLQPGPDGHVYLYRSRGNGKSARTRSYEVTDSDQSFYRNGYLTTSTFGALNDSSGVYAMAGIGGAEANGEGTLDFIFSGGAAGVDPRYEAHYGPQEDRLGTDDIFGWARGPIPDCNGDGWDDYYTGYHGYGGFNRGIALVLAGGPYIPRDDPTTSVQDIGVAGKPRAITVWPNPARQEVNIAWRGDLRPMPQRFEAHRLSGELVARGEVEPYRGSALWRCEGLAAGTYLLTIFDADGGVIATARVVKEE